VLILPVLKPPTFCAGWLPFQLSDPVPPDELQEVPLVDDQVSVAESPGWIAVGATLRVTPGALTVPTNTKPWLLTEPPDPVHVSP
jgi:hypothetical protein